jgi:hypothetical protein
VCGCLQTVMLLSSVKAMRSFRLVQDHQVVPPWTCALLVSLLLPQNQSQLADSSLARRPISTFVEHLH